MREHEQPVIQTINASDIRTEWGKIAADVFAGKKRVLVEKNGVPVGAIISARDLEYLQAVEAQRERDFVALDTSRAAFEDVPDEEIQREVDRAIAEIRAENRQRAKRTSAQ